MNQNEIDKIWFAGFFEAEGNVEKNRVRLYQNDPTPLQYAQNIWGGHLKERIKKSPSSDKICSNYTLSFRKKEYGKFLDDILPYMRIPRKINQVKNHKDVNDDDIKDKLTDTELNIYFAGFYEGDGYVSNDITANNSLLVGMDQQTKEPFDLVVEKWGGKITERLRKSPASDKMCTTFSWVAKRKLAEEFIYSIEPYMLIPYKINQIKSALSKMGQKTGNRYNCSHCNQTFSSPANRRRHEKDKHLNTNGHKCTKCDKVYKDGGSLNYHIKTKHTENSTVKCKECDKELSSDVILKRHIKIYHK